MKKLLIILLSFLWLLSLPGCTGLEKVQFWNKGKEARQVQTEDKKQDKAKEPVEKDFSVASADQLDGRQALTLYGVEKYAEISAFIRQSTLDKFISGVLLREKTKTLDNPYLIGDTKEDGSPKGKLASLEDMIINVNPVDWKIVQLTPVNDESMLVNVKYFLPDGREITADRFIVKLQAEEWYIDFESFNDSFTKVARFARAGHGPLPVSEASSK